MTGFQIIELREALNMSRPELAHALNVVPATLANWEKNGPHNLGAEVLGGLHSAVFDTKDQGADRSARIERIADELRLGLGALLFRRIMEHVGASR